MTNVNITPLDGGYYFECLGHSGYAAKGSDIVCAAVSALCFTLLIRLEDIKNEGLIIIKSYHVSDGEICAEFYSANTSYAKTVLDSVVKTIEAGFDSLSKSYPDYVSFG